MGFRIRKSFKVAPGVRMTVGRRGTSFSVGNKFYRQTFSTTGRRTSTVKLPGTGLSYSRSSGGTGRGSKRAAQTPMYYTPPAAGYGSGTGPYQKPGLSKGRIGCLILLTGLLLLMVCGMIGALVQKPQTTKSTISNGARIGGNPNSSNTGGQGEGLAPTSTPDALLTAAGAGPAVSDYFYFPATSHAVTGFGSLFKQFRGVEGLGYPLTEQFIERSPVDDKWRWVQYFEKAVVEYHPDLPAANRLQIAALGTQSLKAKYPNGQPNASTVVVPGGGAYKFAETGHTVTGAFLKRWHSGGEVAHYGYPLTEAFSEKNDADGKTYTVQYFERAVMEYHPDQKPPYDVQLAALGAQRLSQLYPRGAPRGASNPIPSPTPDLQATQQAELARANATATARAVADARANATADAVTAARATATVVAYERQGTATVAAYQHQATVTAVAYSRQTIAYNATATAISVSIDKELAHIDATSTAIAKEISSWPAPGSGTGGFIPYPGNGLGPTRCRDGSLSHSAGRGTCSHHGGVAP